MNRTPTKGKPLTLSEHFFWTVIGGLTGFLLLAVLLFVAA